MFLLQKWNEIKNIIFIIIIINFVHLSKQETINNPVKISDYSNPAIYQTTTNYYLITSGEKIILNNETCMKELNTTFAIYSSPYALCSDESNNYYIFSRNGEDRKCYLINSNGEILTSYESYYFPNSNTFIGYLKESKYVPSSLTIGKRCEIPENEIIIYGKNQTNILLFTYLEKSKMYSILLDSSFEDKIICKTYTSAEYICALSKNDQISIVALVLKVKTQLNLLNNECNFEGTEIIITSMDCHTEVQLYDLPEISDKILCAKNKNNLNIECIIIHIYILERQLLTIISHSIDYDIGSDIILSVPTDSDNNGDCALSNFDLEYLFCCGGNDLIKCARLNNNYTLTDEFTLNIPGENAYLNIIYTGLSFTTIFYMNTLSSEDKIYEYFIIFQNVLIKPIQ